MLCALACTCVSGACESRQQLVQEAEARAKFWGFPAPRIVHDVVYAEYGQRRLKLDVYLPPKSDQRGAVPGVVVVRGGAWRYGDKEFFGYIAGRLAMEGFVAASIEYRTSDEARFPAAVQDVKAAVRWMRAHAVAYGVNPDTIGAIGGSAGAHLVAMLATSGGVMELEGGGGNSAMSSDVQAVVAMACGCNLQWKEGVGPEFIRAVTGFIGAPLEAHAQAITAHRLPTSAAVPRPFCCCIAEPILMYRLDSPLRWSSCIGARVPPSCSKRSRRQVAMHSGPTHAIFLKRNDWRWNSFAGT